jgi:hypothetical protein
MSRVAGLSKCPNCDARLGGNYCPQCGQKITPINPSLHDFLHDLTHELLHVDGKIFRSVRLLLTRPGFLTAEYFRGRRATYVSPIRLYLIFSVAFFAAASLVGTEVIFELEPGEEVEVGALGRMLGLKAMSPEEVNALVNRAMHDWVPRAMFVLVPLGALLVQLVTRRSGRNYPQHLYFALHLHAAYFALLAVTTVLELLHNKQLSNVLSVFRTIVLLGYLVIAFRTAYGGSWRLATGRTAFVFLTYMLAVSLMLILASVGVLLT